MEIVWDFVKPELYRNPIRQRKSNEVLIVT